MTDRSRILVIKLGAFGDFVQAFGPFAAIRSHHRKAEITLLTTPPFMGLAEKSDWFDRIDPGGRPAGWRIDQALALRRRLREGGFARVYDLQTSDRSSAYFQFFRSPRPKWSGIARGCSHPHANPKRDFMHTRDRQAEQLAMAGIAQVPDPDLAWLDAETARFELASDYVLLAPGGAVHRPAKRWPHYAELAVRLAAKGLRPVILGGGDEKEIAGEITAACPAALDLTAKTDLLEIAGLARRAQGAIGNDTGPMHLVATLGCPSLVLFSDASDPALCAQRGPRVEILHRPQLDDLGVAEVEAALPMR